MAIENKTEGIAPIHFVVDKLGNITNITVDSNPGDRTGNAAAWVIDRMNYLEENWRPGLKDGVPTNTRAALFVKF